MIIGKFVYFAHPLRGLTVEATQQNRKSASVLVARFVARYHVAPVCAWIHLADEWTEAEGRALGLQIDCRLIDLVALGSGELWIIGPRVDISEGMRIEVSHARSLGVTIDDRRGEEP